MRIQWFIFYLLPENSRIFWEFSIFFTFFLFMLWWWYESPFFFPHVCLPFFLRPFLCHLCVLWWCSNLHLSVRNSSLSLFWFLAATFFPSLYPSNQALFLFPSLYEHDVIYKPFPWSPPFLFCWKAFVRSVAFIARYWVSLWEIF